MAKRFLTCDLEQPYLLPPSLQDWLPTEHLARFIADVAEQLDLSAFYAAYDRKDGRGLAAYHPLMLCRLLLYGYAIGVRSSRAIEKATYDDLAFRYLSADQHPDHDTIAHFRQQHLPALADLFVQALQLCRQAGLLKLGTLAIDGTKVKAQAHGRQSMRLAQIRQQEERLQTLTDQLLQQAAETDAEEDARWGKGQPVQLLPRELADAQKRLKRLRHVALRGQSAMVRGARLTTGASFSQSPEVSGRLGAAVVAGGSVVPGARGIRHYQPGAP